MRPYDVTSTDQLLDMESDNHPQDPAKWSILHNGEYLTLHAPNGCGFVSIPRDQFNEIVDWYIADQTKKAPGD